MIIVSKKESKTLEELGLKEGVSFIVDKFMSLEEFEKIDRSKSNGKSDTVISNS